MRRLPFEVANEKLLPLEFLMPIKYADAAGCSAASSPLGLPSLLANPRGQLTLTLGKCCGAPQDQVCSTKLQLSQLGCLSREFTIKYDGLAFVCCLASSCLYSFPSSPSPLTPYPFSLSIFDLVAAARRQVCNSISLLFNPAPQSPAIRLCARFMYYICILQQVRGAKEKGAGAVGEGTGYHPARTQVGCAGCATKQ